MAIRKFLKRDLLQAVVDWATVETEGLNVQLVTTFPREVYSNHTATLEQLGIGPLNNNLIVEVIK